MVIVGHIYAINVECRPTCCAIDNINRHSFVYWSVQISAISGHISVWRFLLCWCTMPSCDLRRQFILIVFWSILPHRVVRVQHFLYNNISVGIYIENESRSKQQNQKQRPHQQVMNRSLNASMNFNINFLQFFTHSNGLYSEQHRNNPIYMYKYIDLNLKF